MATFVQQVEGLTGFDLTGSTDPTETELTQFLIDGVLDVTSKWLEVKPSEAEFFMRSSAETTSNGSLTLDRSSIIEVVREAGVNNDWRRCNYIGVDLQSRVLDKESIHYASAYNPAYIVAENGAISVFPVPGSDPNAFKVYYINNEPKGDGTSDSLAYGHSTIGYFPKKLTSLVVIYAAIKSLEAKMAFYATDEEDLELVESIKSNIIALQTQYNTSFGIVAEATQQKVSAQRERTGQ
jgi:hypothetical protein